MGKLVAFPTDTYFALGAILQETAVERLFDAKGRMAGNPVPVLLSSSAQAAQVSGKELSSVADILVRRFWPGPLTLVLPANSSVPGSVTAGTGKIGVRVPDHELARELISLVGSPVTGTSANLSGGDPCKSADEVLSQLGGVIDAVVDAPCGIHTAPSTVVSFDDEEFRILREGAIAEADIRQATNRL